MYFSNEFLQTILLLGFVQGSISSILLWRTAKIYPPSRLIAVLLLLVSLACLNIYFFHAAWFQHSVVLGVLHAVIPLVIIMPVGPLLYFYVRGDSTLSRLHLLPVIIDLVPYLAALVYICGYTLHLFNKGPRAWADFIDDYNAFADIPRWLSISIYLALAWHTHRPQQWIKALLIGFFIFQVIWLIYLIPYLWPGYNIRLLEAVGWYPVMVPLVILIYWAGIKAWLFGRQQPARPKAQMPEDTINETLQQLEKAMQNDRLYLDPQLQVEKVAAHTGLSAKTITAVLNQHRLLRFNQWVNAYRVDAFKERLAAGAGARLTLEGIARECGFNSSTSFQRAFKQLTGMVPTEYRDRLYNVKVRPHPDLGTVTGPV